MLIIAGMTAMTLAGCQRQDEVTETPETEPSYVLADLALSLPPSSSGTRLVQDVTEGGTANGGFRGISKLSIIPFTKQGKVTSTDMPSYYESSSVVSTGWTVVDNIHHYQKLYLMHGVASFLTYGEGTKKVKSDDPDDDDKVFYGSLIPKVSGQSQTEGIMPDRLAVTPANLTFELEKIYKESTTPAGATAIANYLTQIAQAKGTISPGTEDEVTVSWKNAQDSWLQLLYLNFTNQSDQDANIIPGSARNVKALVNTLYTRLAAMNYNDGTIEKAIVTDILSRITNETYVTTVDDGNTLTVKSLGEYDSYPNDIYLPDGAAAVRWVNDAFAPQTVTTLDAPINTINRFAYPPALYYYSNSRIKASNNDVEASAYTSKTWAELMSDVRLYPYDNAVVNGNTKAVAIKEPLQYGVAHLSATIASTASSLPDADGTSIDVGSNFPVTGIIICGQRPVDFEFKVKMNNGQPTGDELFMYDSCLTPTYLKFGDPASGPFETMVLQSEDGKDVTIMLELENNSGKNFKGEDGYIYKGTKFYLTGQVKLNQGSDSGVADSEKEDVKKRVFTQDHTTKMTMKVQTLAHAYNVMPNILSGRLQIGVDIKLNWVEATPSTVILTGETGEETTNGD